MENEYGLLENELKQLIERGFVVKNTFSFRRVLLNIPFLLIAPILSGVIMLVPKIIITLIYPNIFSILESYGISSLYTAGIFLMIPWFYVLIKIFYDFALYGKEFFYQTGYMIKKINPKKGKYFKIGEYLMNLIQRDLNNIKNLLTGVGIILFMGPVFILITSLIALLLFSAYIIHPSILFGILLFPVIFTFFSILSALIRNGVEYSNPLYAFGNIGMKLQELTPEIESQSKLIQSEFQKEQNFSVLRSEFEKLSSTFSHIVGLVVRLEKIEARANKGNLFDSGKYIGSLRADIVTPLSELKEFLEEQRDSLMSSQKELSRVRVGGADDSLGANGALSSKRSDILLVELDESIGKIGGMIEKMG